MTAEEFNLQCVEQLKAADFSRRVAVIGSGPSAPYVTTMDGLLAGLAKTCNVTAQPGEFPWDTFERAHAANNAGYFQQIRDAFVAMSPHWDSRAYKHLANIGFRSYVTFNYDGQLPRAFLERNAGDPSLFSVYPGQDGHGFDTAQPADFEHRCRLVAIHGYADEQNAQWPQQVILRRTDYNHHYVEIATGRYLHRWWKNLLTRFPCVFMGTSLREPGLDRVLEDLQKDNNPRLFELDHIHLLGVERAPTDPFYPALSPTLGVFRKIAYDRLDLRHTGLINVLSKFSNIPTTNPSPVVTAVRPITIGDNFSFGS